MKRGDWGNGNQISFHKNYALMCQSEEQRIMGVRGLMLRPDRWDPHIIRGNRSFDKTRELSLEKKSFGVLEDSSLQEHLQPNYLAHLKPSNNGYDFSFRRVSFTKEQTKSKVIPSLLILNNTSNGHIPF